MKARAVAVLVGTGWGTIASLIGITMSGRIILAGALCSPLIGLLVYRLMQPIYETASGCPRALTALVSLYLGSITFAIAMGLGHWLLDLPAQPVEAFSESLGFILYGTTAMSWALWPLAAGSHAFMQKHGDRGREESISLSC